MANRFSKKYGNKGRAFNYLQIKVMSRCLSAPDATHCGICQVIIEERVPIFVI